MSTEECVFCQIVQNIISAHRVYEDELTLAFMDFRQAHPGHVLIIPKRHVKDIRDLDPETGAALMAGLTKMAAAVSVCFSNQGISVWHSIDPAAFQEVPHLHFHVHPREIGDGLVKIYPGDCPNDANATDLEKYTNILRIYLENQN